MVAQRRWRRVRWLVKTQLHSPTNNNNQQTRSETKNTKLTGSHRDKAVRRTPQNWTVAKLLNDWTSNSDKMFYDYPLDQHPARASEVEVFYVIFLREFYSFDLLQVIKTFPTFYNPVAVSGAWITNATTLSGRAGRSTRAAYVSLLYNVLELAGSAQLFHIPPKKRRKKKRRALGEICATRVALLLGETKIVKKCKEFSLVFKQTRLINSLPRT